MTKEQKLSPKGENCIISWDNSMSLEGKTLGESMSRTEKGNKL